MLRSSIGLIKESYLNMTAILSAEVAALPAGWPRIVVRVAGSWIAAAGLRERVATGLLAGVAPMLLHKTQSPHPERPARVVAIYHELFEQELVSRARLVPTRLASMEDLALVHDRKLVRRATATYDTDEDATAALGIERCVVVA